MKPILFALLTALFWGVAPIFEKLGLRRVEPIVALAIRTAVVFISFTVFIFASGSWRMVQKQDSQTIIFIVLGALAAGVFGQIAYFYALKTGSASNVVPIVASYPLIASMIAITLLKEPVTVGKVLGAALIVLGVLSITLDKVVWNR